MPAQLTSFAQSLSVESAFTVLAVAKRLKAEGKQVIELEIGDSPFETTASAKRAGIEAITANHTRYTASTGIPELRGAISRYLDREFGIQAAPEQVVIGSGSKVFQQFFCEAFVNPGDGVLIFSPHFPTYVPNVLRRGGRPVYSALRQSAGFRPEPAAVEKFLREDPSPRAIFLNSPQNPTGGVASEDDLKAIADLVRGRNIAVFSDEPYCHMVWQGAHRSIAALPDMLEHTVACYTFSKSYNMGGWRLGFAVSSRPIADAIAKMINTTLSCVTTMSQMAGRAALDCDDTERDDVMERFRKKVQMLTDGLNAIDGFKANEPAGTFYVFPGVQPVCNRLGITSHGLAMYLLEGADDERGVACLGGECFGEAGAGFLRFSCAEPDDALREAFAFVSDAIGRADRVERYLSTRPEFRLRSPYTAT
jgi:aspartate aminotransferase